MGFHFFNILIFNGQKCLFAYMITDQSFIRDNHSNGTVGGFLKQSITKNSDVSIVSAYFTIYAYPPMSGKMSRRIGS